MNSKARSSLLLALVALALANARLAAQAKGTLSVSVVDTMGAAAPGAMVSLRWNDLGDEMSWNGVRTKHKTPRKKEREMTLSLDSGGHVSIPLFPGTWDIFAYTDGYYPVCTVVGIESGQTTTIELRFPRLVRMVLE